VKKNPTLVTIGQQIREARAKAGISQEELAYRVDLDRTYVGGVERGERNLGVLNLFKLAEALNIPAFALIKGISLPKEEE
jgi:transcriptional regulator with XRE-family HTH domain